MAVYVDEIRLYVVEQIKPGARRCGQLWCHMTADTREELHAFALRLGLKRRWFQDHAILRHYDLTPPVRRRAVEIGAVEVVARKHLLRLFHERTGVRNASP